jgi:hypothetical protein
MISRPFIVAPRFEQLAVACIALAIAPLASGQGQAARGDLECIERWVEGMATRVTATMDGLPRLRCFRMTEYAHWASSDRQARAQHSELFFADASLWRLSHEVGQGSRIDQGRQGDEAWDLGAGVLVQYSAEHGRIDPARAGVRPADLNHPLRSRLASFGYCLTGGLHLIHLLELGERAIIVEASTGDWVLRAFGERDEVVFFGSWSAMVGEGTVREAVMVRASVPARVGYRWTFSDWRVDPELPGAIATRVVGFNSHGGLDHERHLDFVWPTTAESIRSLSRVPEPGARDLLLGEIHCAQRSDRRRGADELFGWDGARWLRVLDTLRESAYPVWTRVLGWCLALVVVVHVLWLRWRVVARNA